MDMINELVAFGLAMLFLSPVWWTMWKVGLFSKNYEVKE